MKITISDNQLFIDCSSVEEANALKNDIELLPFLKQQVIELEEVKEEEKVLENRIIEAEKEYKDGKAVKAKGIKELIKKEKVLGKSKK